MGISRYIATAWQTFRAWVVTTVGNIGIADIIDMLIIAFIIYKLLQFLRRSRLGLIAKSILILLGALWLSGRLGLMVVNFATSIAFELGILALVILFQPEIRQSLERIGRKNITTFFWKDDNTGAREFIINQVITACLQMAKENTGALIVFEREVTLKEEAGTGTAIDAKVSSALLESLFYDHSPLHDGAVIISADRIAAAGCILPLTDNANLSRELGMRHRAAIGVSEQSDALAIIVSEESGSISVAVSGRLRRRLTEETFRKLLETELMAGESTQLSKVRRLLKGKWHEKDNR